MSRARSSKRPVLLVSLGAVVLVLIVVLLVALRRSARPGAERDVEGTPAGGRAAGGRHAATDDPAGPGGVAGRAPGAAAGGQPEPRRRLGAEERARLLEALHRRLGEPAARRAGGSGGEVASSAAGPVHGTLDKDYIRDRVREIVPLVKECYQQALARGPGDAGTADGVLKVRFSIIGDPELGGVIEDSKVLEDTPLAANASLAECVQESMYAMQLEPPKGGGRVNVTYPFRFKSSADDKPAPAR